MRNYNRLFFGLLFFAFILFISTTSHAFDKSLDQGLDEIAQKVTKSIPAGAKKTVAVMDFNSIEGGVTVFGRFIGEELITKLFESERFKVIERSLLEKALEELKFNTSDLVDPSVAKQLGKVVGADAIVTGTLSDLGQSVKINARVIMVESGEVIGAAGAQIIKDASVVNMMKKVVSKSKVKSINNTNMDSEQNVFVECWGDDLSDGQIGGWKSSFPRCILNDGGGDSNALYDGTLAIENDKICVTMNNLTTNAPPAHTLAVGFKIRLNSGSFSDGSTEKIVEMHRFSWRPHSSNEKRCFEIN